MWLIIIISLLINHLVDNHQLIHHIISTIGYDPAHHTANPATGAPDPAAHHCRCIFCRVPYICVSVNIGVRRCVHISRQKHVQQRIFTEKKSNCFKVLQQWGMIGNSTNTRPTSAPPLGSPHFTATPGGATFTDLAMSQVLCGSSRLVRHHQGTPCRFSPHQHGQIESLGFLSFQVW